MAATAAAVAVAATAASAAASAAGGAGGGGGSAPTVQAPGPREALMRREQYNILGGARDMGRNANAQLGMITPALYDFAGFDTEQDPEAVAAYDAANQRATAAQQARLDAQAELDSLRGLTQSERKQLKIKDPKKFEKARNKLRKARILADREAEVARTEADAAASNLFNPTSIKKRAGGLGTEEERGVSKLLLDRVNAALSGNVTEDPYLTRKIEEDEAVLRAKLGRQFGSDYETSTAGQYATQEFGKRKNELLADYARRDINEFLPLRQQFEGSLAELAGSRMRLALAPQEQYGVASQRMQQLAGSYQQAAAQYQEDRLAQFQGDREAAAREQAQPNGWQLAGQALGNLGQGLGSYAFSTGGAAAPTAAQPNPSAPGVSTMGALWDRTKSWFGSGQSPYTAGY